MPGSTVRVWRKVNQHFKLLVPPLRNGTPHILRDAGPFWRSMGRLPVWAALSPTSSRAVYRGVVEASIYLDSKFRSLGLGTVLLSHLCDESEKQGFYSLYASIFETNKASYNMNLKSGFREVGYREKIAKDKFGNWQNTIIMERRSKKIF